MLKINNYNPEMLTKFNKSKIFTFANPYSYYLLDENIVNEFDAIFADGILLVLLNNFFSNNKINRFSFDFTSLAPIVFNFCEIEKLNVAIVGGSEYEIKIARFVIESKYPSINIVCASSGYFDSPSEIIGILADANVEVVIAGLGTPLQENFLIECKESIPNLKFGFTCGGFLTQISQNVNYFHPFFDKLNLRWFQRFYRHSYVRKRLLLNYPFFVFKFIFNNFFGK
jgi:UDP-Gal:alpha-D-GlcNAc-diphosphoundecaprenol beta-1,4-galactosyltransferase